MAGDEGLEADDRIGVELRACLEDRADGEVVDWQTLGGGKLGVGVGGVTEECVGANDGASFGRWEVGLTDVEAKAEEGCIVRPVIENEISFAFSAFFQNDEEVAGELRFVADLNPVRSTIDGGFKDINQRMSVQVRRVENRVEHLLLDRRLVVRIGPRRNLQAAADPAQAFSGIRRNIAAAHAALNRRRFFVNDRFLLI
jgi:hypothetical protein